MLFLLLELPQDLSSKNQIPKKLYIVGDPYYIEGIEHIELLNKKYGETAVRNFQLGLLTKISDLDFEYFIIKKNIKSSSLDLTKDMFFENEPNELILVLNEIAYLLIHNNSKYSFILCFSLLMSFLTL